MATRYDNRLLWDLIYTVCNSKDLASRVAIMNIPLHEWSGESQAQVIKSITSMYKCGMEIPRFKFLHQNRLLNDETRTAVRTVASDPNEPPQLIDPSSLQQAIANMHEDYQRACIADATKELIAQLSKGGSVSTMKETLHELNNALSDIASNDCITVSKDGVSSETWNDLADSEKNIAAIKTGWKTFDEKCSGIPGAGLTFITAPTGNGKSHVAVSLATKCSMEFQQQVVMATIEMTAMEYFERHVKSTTGVPLDQGFVAASKEAKKAVYRAHTKATENMGEGRLTIFVPQKTVDIIAVLDQAKSYGATMIIVDYLQLFYDDNNRTNRTEYLKKLTSLAHNWGIKNKIAVVMLAQLNADGKMAWVTGASTDAACWLTFEVTQENRDAGQTEINVEKYRGRIDKWSFWVDLDYRRSRIWESESRRGIGSNYPSEER